MTRSSRLLPLVLVPPLLAACATPPRLSEIERGIFVPRCNAAGCHDAGGRAGSLDLTPGRAWASLVNVPARNVGAVEEGFVRVVPGRADLSFLILKLGTHVPVAWGVRMPVGGTPLAQDEVDRISAWIDAGAADD